MNYDSKPPRDWPSSVRLRVVLGVLMSGDRLVCSLSVIRKD